MRALRILRNNLVESIKGVFRNFSLSMASISCITITLILVGLSIILSINVNNSTDTLQKELTIVVFLEKDTTDEEIIDVKRKLNLMDNIQSIEFKSKEDAKKTLEKEYSSLKEILEGYTEEDNPIPDAYYVKVDDLTNISKTAEKIEQINKVELVKYGEGKVEEIVKIFTMIRKITYIVVVALIIITAYLISNTIKITIQSRRREIEIRRLVGASNAYIKQPFFFEGIILGFLGSIIPVLTCYYGYSYLYDKLGGKVFTTIIKLVEPSDIFLSTSCIIIAIGVVVGAFGSYRAVRKYLKI